MATGVKELFFHHAISAATVVMPAVTSCSTVWLSMGSTGLPKCNAEVLAGFTNGILNETELFCDVWSIYKHQKAETLDFGHALPKNTQRNSSEPGFEKMIAYRTETSRTIDQVLDIIHLARRAVKKESRRELQLHGG